MTYDIIVAGGGPAGNKAASLLAKHHSVLVVEDHDTPGTPVQCTGLISDEVLELSGVRPTILNGLYGANIIFPNGKKITIRSKERKAVLIDRNELDRMMAEKASDDGAEHAYSERYMSHSTSDAVKITTDKRTLTASLLIGADGHRSAVARTIRDNTPSEYVRGIQADIGYRSEEEDMITIRIGSGTAPGFFSWEIPFGDTTRVGLCTSWDHGPPSEYLGTLLRRIGADDKRIVKKYSGRIPMGGQRRTYAERLLLIGDAACQVKPISGGGLQPAFRSAYALSETVNEAFDRNDLSENFLSVYEKRWKQDTGKELRRGYRLRRMYVSMNDGELNKISEIADNERIRDMLNDGNIDRPSDLIFPVMRSSAVFRLAPIMAKAWIRGMRRPARG